MRWLIVALLSLSLVFAAQAKAPSIAFANPVPGTAQTFSWGSGSGTRGYIVYTSKRYRAGQHVPLVVLLHGCTASAYQMMESSLYNPVADTGDFVVLYPDVDQQEASMPGFSAQCWDYFDAADWTPGVGDPAAVAGMTRRVMSQWHIDPQRVYLMGMSAGSFLASDVAALYPDLYAAVGEDAGGGFADYDCVTGSSSNITIGSSASQAYAAEGRAARVIPRFMIGGSIDNAVPAACATKSLLQGLRTDNLVIDHRQTAPIRLTPASIASGAVPNGYPFTVATYRDQYGCEIGERVTVIGMKHFWSGGSANPKWAYWTNPHGPSASALSWSFFSQYRLDDAARFCRAR